MLELNLELNLECFFLFSHGIRCNVILPGFIQTSMLATVPPKLLNKVSVTSLSVHLSLAYIKVDVGLTNSP